ncbi:tyrosine-type recombinase/integrase [Lawsonibacter hominis]|uniref:tyrosine-type recombinase/integrase n=1 Tax=Lawsonibacter hominis TaxID=2763053 RepID=UPI00350FF71F
MLTENSLSDLRFHDLRHAFATHALANGVDAKTLSGILGHTNKASFTVDTYTHTTTDMHKKAAEIVGGFLTDYLGEEMSPWQNVEPAATAAST